MFGINEITWSEFLRFITISLAVWYIFLLTIAWIKSKQKTGHGNYEDYHSENATLENLQPIAVSSQDYPSEIWPVNPVENEELPATLYEETGYDEGLDLEHFMEKNSPLLAKMIAEIHVQQ